jgi:hypothetical protein
MKKNLFFIAITFIALLFTVPTGTVQQAKMHTQGVNLNFSMANIPLYFIPNKGQVNQEAVFYARTAKYVLWLTKDGLIFAGDAGSKERNISRLNFVNANKNPEIIAEGETKHRVNYFLGSDPSRWYCDIPTHQAVLYKNLYKNIDLKVYGKEKQVEYDWIIKPGGNPTDICFEYQNVESVQLDQQGNLVIETGMNNKLIHQRPVSYQDEKNKVDAQFKKLGENVYGFTVGKYDPQRELIIDPVVLTYSTYLGGKLWEAAQAIAVDNSGYTYVTGGTWSANFPLKNAYQSTAGTDNFNAFVTKIDTRQKGTPSLIYSTYLGGANPDNGADIAVDNKENVYVSGETWSEDFPTKNTYQNYMGDADVFVVKLDTTKTGASSLIYSTYFGGTDADSATGIALDAKGNAYVAGWTYSLDFPTLNPYQSVLVEGATDGFVARFDTSRSGASALIYSTLLGGTASDSCLDIAVDNNYCAYVTGWTYSKNFPTKNQYQSYRGISDTIVSKINTAGSGASSLLYSTYLGGKDSEYGEAIAVDPNNSGYVYVTGITRSSNFPLAKYYQKYQGDTDGFVVGLNTTRSGSSSFIYSTYLGGDKQDKSYGIAVDTTNSRCVYVTGVTKSSNFPTLNPYQTSQGENNEDAFISKIDTAGTGSSCLLFSTYLGGNGSDCGNDIAVDAAGNITATGLTFSTNFPTLNYYRKDPGDSNADAFITQLFLEPDKPPAIQLNRTTMNFSAVAGGTGAHTGSQAFFISNSGGGTLNWTTSASAAWLTLAPTSGEGDASVSVSIDATGLTAGSTSATITVSDPEAENSPQTIAVNLTVIDPGSTNPPFGDFSTPVEGSTVSSSIAVTGWVLDDIGVESVKIYRLDGETPVYIGDALFVEGARPDIETAYPGYPNNYRAGWGYMLLTHFLPNGGNGTFTLQAAAVDAEGQQVTLGSHTIIADNAHAVKPFGAIDTPTQGGTATGTKFTNWAWVLTPQPNNIPTNGSTLNVWIDGLNIGHPTYNVARPDIAGFFPGYANSSGAGGYFNLDTTQYSNGIHVIFWTATDSAGNADGIGSRYFTIQNSGNDLARSSAPLLSPVFDSMSSISTPYNPIRVKKGFKEDSEAESVYPDDKGLTHITLKELERVEIHFPDTSLIKPLGMQVTPGRYRSLPIGSSLDREKNNFYWQPGPGFVGQYRLVFLTEDQAGKWSKRNILVHIAPGSTSGNSEQGKEKGIINDN